MLPGAAAEEAGSSTSINLKQAAKVEAGTQVYFAFYDAEQLDGPVTSNSLIDSGGE